MVDHWVTRLTLIGDRYTAFPPNVGILLGEMK